MLDQFFLQEAVPPGLLLTGVYDPLLVALSIGVAVLTSGLALQLAAQAAAAHEALHRTMALVSGGIALGVGIWAMHFIGMLAFTLCTSVHYDVPTTLASMLPALAASWVALGLLARRKVNRWQLLAGGALVGAGIGAMHYGGMAAMQMTPHLRYDPAWFAASIAVAVLLAMLALWVRFPLQQHSGMSPWVANLIAGCVMGTAISGMHYTAMAAARFVGPGDAVPAGNPEWVTTLALTVAFVTLGVATFVGVINGLLRYRDLYRKVDRSESRLRALVDTAVDGIITIDQHGIVQSFNHSAQRIFGWTPAEVLGRNVRMLMPQPHRAAHNSYLRRYLQTGEAHIIGTGREVQGVRKDGSQVPLRLGIGRADTPNGPLFVGFMTDLSAAKEAETQLSIAASVFEYSYEAVLILAADRTIVDVNPAFERMTGVPRSQGLGRFVHELYEDVAQEDGWGELQDFTTIWDTVHAQGHWQGELMGRGPSGGLMQRVSIAAVTAEDGAPHHYIVVISDISDIKAYEQELEQFALYDSLTGLPNRRLLNDRLRQTLSQAQRHQSLMAVCYLDLDGFKQVNDQHGHEAGDVLLIEVGRRIQRLLRSEETLARLGGDEMVLLLGQLRQPEDCVPVLQRVLDVVNQPVTLPDGQGFVSASIGYAVYPLDADTPEQLMRLADQAMYASKQSGKNRYTRSRGSAAAPAAGVQAAPPCPGGTGSSAIER
ncbi:diguanylate cyclase domain-containing protein [Paracidovorax wautersii]|uniref:Diguanylate cyclase (GGDEF)-like protein/PAS domain S-box-containing protein n=1 Tax=Paracidovorax wautersii TaxID=1177982 RepID=A0ABU1IGM1_9BURK|nr:diguanylate cyclase [Paracidovorax wautersii]MDR6215563.1 diguanylate cyclase (GGDEF)-like protein/PAS domain S-box-containing protein [Paracidovorax wautersii]